MKEAAIADEIKDTIREPNMAHLQSISLAITGHISSLTNLVPQLQKFSPARDSSTLAGS